MLSCQVRTEVIKDGCRSRRSREPVVSERLLDEVLHTRVLSPAFAELAIGVRIKIGRRQL